MATGQVRDSDSFTEDDVALAREYRDLLVEIRELHGSSDWSDDDVETAKAYASTLREISQLLE